MELVLTFDIEILCQFERVSAVLLIVIEFTLTKFGLIY